MKKEPDITLSEEEIKKFREEIPKEYKDEIHIILRKSAYPANIKYFDPRTNESATIGRIEKDKGSYKIFSDYNLTKKEETQYKKIINSAKEIKDELPDYR